jgi:hypothetical protein
LIAKAHKNTNAPLILKIRDIIFFLVLGKLHNGPFLGLFRGALNFFEPLEISLEMAHYVVCPQKKIISRIFKISGALIVNLGSEHIRPRTMQSLIPVLLFFLSVVGQKTRNVFQILFFHEQVRIRIRTATIHMKVQGST